VNVSASWPPRSDIGPQAKVLVASNESDNKLEAAIQSTMLLTIPTSKLKKIGYSVIASAGDMTGGNRKCFTASPPFKSDKNVGKEKFI
jgi:hypothetical protein